MTREGRRVSTFAGGENALAFVPPPLPPEPGLQLGAGLMAALSRADQAVGRLDGIASVIPDPSLFVYMYVRKEAVLSSQIEGTQSSLSDLMLHEVEPAAVLPHNDIKDLSNYVAAMQHGLGSELPISKRLLREVHRVLMASVRGGGQALRGVPQHTELDRRPDDFSCGFCSPSAH